MLSNVIAFAGEYSSGKDYFADYLINKYFATRLSFSDEVRILSHEIFPWLPLYITPSEKDIPWVHPSNKFNLTPREIWISVGRVRDIQPNIFVERFKQNQFKRATNEKNRGFIITDFRTPQEYDFLKENGIPIIKIELHDRTGLPPSEFEEYIRNFTDYDAKFVHQKDGIEGFEAFFDEYRLKLSMPVTGVTMQ